MQAELAFFPLVGDRNPVTMPVFDVSGNGVPPERDRYYTLSPDREAIGQLSYFRIFGYNDAKVDPHQFNWWKFWWRISVRNSHDKEVWFENFSVRCDDANSPSGEVMQWWGAFEIAEAGTLPHLIEPRPLNAKPSHGLQGQERDWRALWNDLKPDDA